MGLMFFFNRGCSCCFRSGGFFRHKGATCIPANREAIEVQKEGRPEIWRHIIQRRQKS